MQFLRLTALERQVRERYGADAEAILARLSLDYAERICALHRLLHGAAAASTPPDGDAGPDR